MRDFSHLNEGKFSRFKMWLLGTAIAMALGGGIAFFIFYFQVENIVLERDEADSNLRYSEILQTMEHVKKQNIFVLSTDFLERQLQIRFPELSVVSISKKYPKTLSLEAKTDPVVLKFVYSVENKEDQLFGFVSEKGIFFHNGDNSMFPIFEKTPRKTFISPLDRVFENGEVNEILAAKNLLEEVMKRTIISAELIPNAQEIHFVDEHDVRYWIFLKQDFTEQIEKFRRAIAEKNIYETPIEYIDLRIGRKVIYKPK